MPVIDSIYNQAVLSVVFGNRKNKLIAYMQIEIGFYFLIN